ncbi:MAG: potassium transporter KtrB [Henriciella sp.]|jgi:trk system potassium uptake protein TrkH|uniref:TrkH family potassium uptake protein n=1 Tax=Henriciella sp. TaxID=1968823 RepID=UPI000C10AC4A|nr:potassium transporter TrkG [Henriciella sp.]MAN74128.1 potassium transporter KtrB [Henriciella sp.]MBF34254.1 potassium transporter KtrB [Hyphomonadaceae bacterium]PHR75169.1 MAG: potassium transporter KtrB [Henriciella sp.]|tara:strand:+ start:2902 stop:4275 length:1374 start_codon:yes stop_codon:yes gene_type:complete
MPDETPGTSRRSFTNRLSRGARLAILRTNPAKLLVVGYVGYMLAGWLLLSLPFAHEDSVPAIDNFFISVSAVSTTGLATVDPSSSYSFFGELVILLLIQVGGVGYMTIGSFAVLATVHKLSPLREKITRAAFALPDDLKPGHFILTVVIFTLVCETAGAIALFLIFSSAGQDDAVWSAIFHAVSAFCTAGFSLNPNSFEAYSDNAGLNIVISALSLLGAMGFLVIWDVWRNFTSAAFHLGFTTKVILRMTGAFLFFGTLILFVADPGIASLPEGERLQVAFFQTMTATTTVGFNTVPIGALSMSVMVVLFILMAVGASPSGTGGGLKTTTFAALLAIMRSTLKQRSRVRFFKRPIAASRLQAAGASAVYFLVLMSIAVFLLGLTDPEFEFERIVFEVISALGTVGLSMGITGDLSSLGKLIIIILMTAGRVGILTFGIAIAMHDESRAEEADNELLI